MRVNPYGSYEYDDTSGIHKFYLRDGDVCAMVTDPSVKADNSFQRLSEHCVPLYKHAEGHRLNWTIRTDSPNIRNGLEPNSYDRGTELGEGLVVLRKSFAHLSFFSDLKKELNEAMNAFGEADVTTVYGRTSTNNGRKVLEQSFVEGQTYTYSGKTTKPGKAFGPFALRALELLSQDFGVPVERLWAHLVYYPDPKTCQLGWHSDSEVGVNPHTIISVTFLENPLKGVRPFYIRLKSEKEKRKKRRKKDAL